MHVYIYLLDFRMGLKAVGRRRGPTGFLLMSAVEDAAASLSIRSHLNSVSASMLAWANCVTADLSLLDCISCSSELRDRVHGIVCVTSRVL